MKVLELIRDLAHCDPEATVALDVEGRRYVVDQVLVYPRAIPRLEVLPIDEWESAQEEEGRS